jgi:hypothetical protein
MKRDWSADELAEHWTLAPEEQLFVLHKTGPNALGFALLLKFSQSAGCFPRKRS